MDLQLKGKKAIVTGGTRGIGRRVAERLADEGCDVAICARNDVLVEETVKALESRGVRAFGRALHVKNADAYRGFLEASCDFLGGLDILILNVSAGGGMDSEKNWNRNFDVDVMSVVRGVETTLPWLKKSPAASIVMTGTMAARETFVAPMAYNSLKAAIVAYSQQLAQQLIKRNIRVNCVSPGPTIFEGSAWEMVQLASPRTYNSVIRKHPARRMATADEIANCILFIASPAASWVVGVDFLADGGFTKGVHF
ncbi:SDR family oxidoreductase [Terrarubrum flagellatum]|uniref:SDR family NAD(P)-dependent oxidoreductase n=1 Tax=Terrirubrum flagellatum TaxID=2895980 RepID=UPI0031454C20